LTVRRRLPGVALALALLTGSLAGALVASADHSTGTRNLACSTCPRPLEPPR